MIGGGGGGVSHCENGCSSLLSPLGRPLGRKGEAKRADGEKQAAPRFPVCVDLGQAEKSQQTSCIMCLTSSSATHASLRNTKGSQVDASELRGGGEIHHASYPG